MRIPAAIMSFLVRCWLVAPVFLSAAALAEEIETQGESSATHSESQAPPRPDTERSVHVAAVKHEKLGNSSKETRAPLASPVEAGSEAAKLQEVLRVARRSYQHIGDSIQDYTCDIYKRERVDGRLHGAEFISAKIRHAQERDGKVVVPFSVFLRFRSPERVKGREVLYTQGHGGGDLIARRGGRRSPNMTMQLEPTSPLAMEGNRYPITEIGIRNLTRQLLEVVKEEQGSSNCTVKIFKNAKLDNRKCTHFLVKHKKREPTSRYYRAHVFVDEELEIPVYYAAYDWPKEEGGKPRLLEEYAYTNIKINVGLTDRDFDANNPDYHFRLLDHKKQSADELAASKTIAAGADPLVVEDRETPPSPKKPADDHDTHAKEKKDTEES